MIYIAGDKHGYRAIELVEEYLTSKNIVYENLGVRNENEDMLLEEMIPKVVKKVLDNDENTGILTCGSGVGVEVGANKFSGVRACLATNEKVAEFARVYDNCNVLCLVSWDSVKENVYKILDAWFGSAYDGSEKRLRMFEEFNKWH